MEKNCVRTDCSKSTVMSDVKAILAMLLVCLFTIGMSSCKNDDGDLKEGSLKGTEWTCVVPGSEDVLNICFNSNTVECFLTKEGALKGDVSSCGYTYVKDTYVKDGLVLSFDDLSLTLNPNSLDRYTEVFKSAKISGKVMEVYSESWIVAKPMDSSRPTPAYTLRRVK